MSLPMYEVHAIRYATVNRMRSENFLVRDDSDVPMPMDYYVWLIQLGEQRILVDTGFNQAAATERKRTLLRCPIESLEALGVTASSISDVILTHMHFDHAGNINKLPSANFHVQEEEMAYATSKYMGYPMFGRAYSVNDVTYLLRKIYEQRVIFHNGDAELKPGISVHKIGGHTRGLQVVRVHTQRGWLVLASDASHFMANVRDRSPFPIVFNMAEMLEGYKIIEALADSPEHIIPGHDPHVVKSYHLVRKDLKDIVRLDLPLG